MANPGNITISNPQNRSKDCYASAPKIDLTIRANGEEKVMVMSALAQWTTAGLETPTAAALSTSVTPNSTVFVANMYWEYRYVYVAKLAYPLVENGQTGGGSPAPRSNPSPSVTANSTVDLKSKRLDIPTTQRNDISHIWIYRTEYFDNAAEAAVFSEAGNMFWIGEVINNPNLATVPFTDNGSEVGEEQIENDNFVAPIFDKVVYADPYFWGFGNSIFTAAVSVTTTGLITITDTNKWYDGRNAQTISFQNITSGGYDNQGHFYFKQLSNTTAQLYSDIALTAPQGLDVNGTTTCTIRGANTTLYRSKPRNPFSWGSTDLIGDLQVPSVYAFPVGGGLGTALAVIPNQNLLKMDTESPSKCYTLNLKNAGTPNFESSLRIISDTFCVSTHQTQFSATSLQGDTVLWGLDIKSFSVIQCDGANQIPISSPVFQILRRLSLTASDRKLYHGVYSPRLELNCVFVKSVVGLSTQSVNWLIYEHAPTGFWGVIEVQDMLCSSQVFNAFTGETQVIVGTETGMVGEMFANNHFQMWFSPQAVLASSGISSASLFQVVCDDILESSPGVPLTGLIGNWATIFTPRGNDPKFTLRYYVRISAINGGTITLDKCFLCDTGFTEFSASAIIPAIPTGTNSRIHFGLIEMQIGRAFNAQIPFDYKNLQQIWSAWNFQGNTNPLDPIAPTVEMYEGFMPINSIGDAQRPLISSTPATGIVSSNDITAGFWALETSLDINQAKIFSIVFRDRNYKQSQLMNYEIRLDPADGN